VGTGVTMTILAVIVIIGKVIFTAMQILLMLYSSCLNNPWSPNLALIPLVIVVDAQSIYRGTKQSQHDDDTEIC
jgi:hypothetical protein